MCVWALVGDGPAGRVALDVSLILLRHRAACLRPHLERRTPQMIPLARCTCRRSASRRNALIASLELSITAAQAHKTSPYLDLAKMTLVTRLFPRCTWLGAQGALRRARCWRPRRRGRRGWAARGGRVPGRDRRVRPCLAIRGRAAHAPPPRPASHDRRRRLRCGM